MEMGRCVVSHGKLSKEIEEAMGIFRSMDVSWNSSLSELTSLMFGFKIR